MSDAAARTHDGRLFHARGTPARDRQTDGQTEFSIVLRIAVCADTRQKTFK